MDELEERCEVWIVGRRWEWRGGELEEEGCEGSERRWRGGGEERGGEGGGGGLELVGEVLVDRQLVDEVVDVGNVVDGGEADAGEYGLAGRGGLREGDGRRWRWGCGGHVDVRIYSELANRT